MVVHQRDRCVGRCRHRLWHHHHHIIVSISNIIDRQRRRRRRQHRHHYRHHFSADNPHSLTQTHSHTVAHATSHIPNQHWIIPFILYTARGVVISASLLQSCLTQISSRTELFFHLISLPFQFNVCVVFFFFFFTSAFFFFFFFAFKYTREDTETLSTVRVVVVVVARTSEATNSCACRRIYVCEERAFSPAFESHEMLCSEVKWLYTILLCVNIHNTRWTRTHAHNGPLVSFSSASRWIPSYVSRTSSPVAVVVVVFYCIFTFAYCSHTCIVLSLFTHSDQVIKHFATPFRRTVCECIALSYPLLLHSHTSTHTRTHTRTTLCLAYAWIVEPEKYVFYFIFLSGTNSENVE